MSKNSTGRRVLVLVTVLAAALALGSPAHAQRRECSSLTADNAAKRRELDKMFSDWKKIKKDLASGEYCSKCLRSKTEIEKQEKKSFEAHLNDVSGERVPAPPDVMRNKENEHKAKVDRIRLDIDRVEAAEARCLHDELKQRNQERVRGQASEFRGRFLKRGQKPSDEGSGSAAPRGLPRSKSGVTRQLELDIQRWGEKFEAARAAGKPDPVPYDGPVLRAAGPERSGKGPTSSGGFGDTARDEGVNYLAEKGGEKLFEYGASKLPVGRRGARGIATKAIKDVAGDIGGAVGAGVVSDNPKEDVFDSLVESALGRLIGKVVGPVIGRAVGGAAGIIFDSETIGPQDLPLDDVSRARMLLESDSERLYKEFDKLVGPRIFSGDYPTAEELNSDPRIADIKRKLKEVEARYEKRLQELGR